MICRIMKVAPAFHLRAAGFSSDRFGRLVFRRTAHFVIAALSKTLKFQGKLLRLETS